MANIDTKKVDCDGASYETFDEALILSLIYPRDTLEEAREHARKSR